MRPTTSPIPAPPGFTALRYHGRDTPRTYTCPGCRRDVAATSQHVVAWPTDADERRRHWHTGCWTSATREGRLDRYYV